MTGSLAGREELVLPVLPLKNTVVFPHVLVPLAVGRPRSLRLLENLPPGDRTLAVAAQYDEHVEEATWEQVRHVGTVVRIQHLLKRLEAAIDEVQRGRWSVESSTVLAEHFRNHILLPPAPQKAMDSLPDDVQRKQLLKELKAQRDRLRERVEEKWVKMAAVANEYRLELIGRGASVEVRRGAWSPLG